MTLVHNHFTSSSVIVTEASLNAKITTLPEGEEGRSSSKLMRSDSAGMQFQGVRGYMSPEFGGWRLAAGGVGWRRRSGAWLEWKKRKGSGGFVRD
ncbi:hypothetical protein LINPERPRIM_LOCUS7303 [Linum perenne]